MKHRTIQLTTVGVVLFIGILSLLGTLSDVPESIIMGGIGVFLIIYGYFAHRLIDSYIDSNSPS